MEILRVPSNTIAYSTTGLEPGDYSYSVIDLADNSVFEGSITSESTSDVLSIELPQNIDGEYEVLLNNSSEVVSVTRPYVDPNTLGTTASEVAEYTKLELIARSIIDNYMDIDFYNKKLAIQTNGTNTDYMPIWKNVNKVLKVYENNVIIYDAEDPESYSEEFGITLDKTAIYRITVGEANIISSATIKLPASSGDIATSIYNYGTFPERYDYTFIVDQGYKNIPLKIKYATEMLIDDLKCGRLDYYQKYVTNYNTDQFRIQFDKKMLDGTGNLIVDKILDEYSRSITRLGVL